MGSSGPLFSSSGGFLRAGRLFVFAAALLGITFSTSLIVKISAAGATWYVDDATCPATGNGTLQTPYCKIQDAICAASSGDLVSVAQGTYPESIRMRPNVDLVSQSGPALTIINGAGKPCTETDFCTKRTGQCSTILFGSGHTIATLLDGFTITGGSGTIQTATTQVAGGGIYVFSSATISNNIITNNTLASTQPNFYGGGIFIAAGAPVITNNIISGNRAIPAAGSSKNPTAGYGAGIYVAFYSSPIITDNIIENNDAGNPNATNSVGGGGGIAIFPGSNSAATAVLDRNVIADNYAADLGGGVHILGLTGAVSSPIITNNVIVGNLCPFEGGGLYVAYIGARIVNNTITDNAGMRGGGLETGVGYPGLPMLITNNIIEGNQITDLGGQGGGIFAYSVASTFVPTISHTDFFGNEGAEVAGDLTEAQVIGTSGNFYADPLFANPATRDFHIDANSPAVDTATASGAPAVDFDVNLRGVDGDGTPNSPEVGDVDVGAFEAQGACSPVPEVCDNLDNDCDGTTDNFPTACGVGQCARTGTCTAGSNSCTPGAPATEICDGLDNNCDGVTDEGWPDTDLDGIKNCLDPDDDNDGVADAGDCAPLNSGSFGFPTEVSNFNVTANPPTRLSWSLQNIGAATTYQIHSGLISRMKLASLGESFCLSASSPTSPFTDPRGNPPPGDGYLYLIRSLNACGAATFGDPNRDLPRSLNACAGGIVDGDEDGSPSDLDCNDADPGTSPLAPEICDNLDNNCDGTTDSFATSCGVGECAATGTCTAGSNSCVPGAPTAEICDALDNNCDGILDNGPDTDLDGTNDCFDADDDNDGAPDVADCAPLNATAFAMPSPVADVMATGAGPTDLAWTTQSAGSGTLYDVTTGDFAAIGAINYPAGSCLGSTANGFTTDAGPNPALGSATYYLVRARNACGTSSYGSAARDASPACP